MTERDTECPGLRERKRRETRLRIEDCATALILERGFDQVTLEEICEEAGVSRRTYFNYFASKDQAASGTGIPAIPQEDLDRFATTDSDNVVRDILRYIGRRIDNDPDISPALSLDEETSLRIRDRRRAIMAVTPHLMVSGMRRFDQLAGSILEAIDSHLTTFPEQRRSTDLSTREEATLLTSFIRQCLITGPLIHPDRDLPREDMLNRTGCDLIGLAAAYADNWD
ncbi:TetR/AcrR family transcriptional regulator [uncultured Corynebacterium sp.]|uniref:TetR/AcrR family transcriptional regulator n=1 Tax=uncultured Corynebacterium sp. TaxID=159447 RepID=UPI0025DA63D8|nr:TetR/AcrR family transcriptional regulator [uncultured Corynebacterium sp.]